MSDTKDGCVESSLTLTEVNGCLLGLSFFFTGGATIYVDWNEIRKRRRFVSEATICVAHPDINCRPWATICVRGDNLCHELRHKLSPATIHVGATIYVVTHQKLSSVLVVFTLVCVIILCVCVCVFFFCVTIIYSLALDRDYFQL